MGNRNRSVRHMRKAARTYSGRVPSECFVRRRHRCRQIVITMIRKGYGFIIVIVVRTIRIGKLANKLDRLWKYSEQCGLSLYWTAIYSFWAREKEASSKKDLIFTQTYVRSDVQCFTLLPRGRTRLA